MKNLYSILGVKKNASPEEIKKAHRKAAMATHPDRNGNPEEFNLVCIAGSILRDETRRAEYDATGAYEKEPEETPYTKAEKKLVEYLFSVLGSTQVAQVSQKDLVKGMRDLIQVDINKCDEEIKIIEINKSIQEKVLSRLSVKKKKAQGLLLVALQENLNTLERERVRTEDNLGNLDLCVELLYDYKYDFDRAPEVASSDYSYPGYLNNKVIF